MWPERYPDPIPMVDELHKANIHAMISIWPVFSKGTTLMPLMHSTGIYKNWRRDIGDKRAFFLIRQAFASQQRNAATLWSTYITCIWSAFRNQVPEGINSCASGIPYWTSDIGGYHFHLNATEKPADPVEIRIYPCAEAEFVHYEYENETYNYEQGKYSTISFNWNETAKTLTIGYRHGDFPEMLKNQTFNIVWVSSGNGTGINPAKKSVRVHYSGIEQKIVRK